MISKTDVVYVNAPHRNIADPRPCVGPCEVVDVFPNHACGPCLMVRDQFGFTTVLERHTIPLAMRVTEESAND